MNLTREPGPVPLTANQPPRYDSVGRRPWTKGERRAWLWLCGGALMSVAHLLVGLLQCCTIVGWKYGLHVLEELNRVPKPDKDAATIRADFLSEVFSRVGDIEGLWGLGALVVWWTLGGLLLVAAHLLLALACALSVVGLPFARAHLGLAGDCLLPDA